METGVPKWFWIALVVIAVVTIGSIVLCNRQAEKSATSVAEEIKPTGSMEPNQQPQDVFDIMVNMQGSLGKLPQS